MLTRRVGTLVGSVGVPKNAKKNVSGKNAGFFTVNNFRNASALAAAVVAVLPSTVAELLEPGRSTHTTVCTSVSMEIL